MKCAGREAGRQRQVWVGHLGFFEALSGVCERDDPGLERGDRLRVEVFFP